MPLRSNNRAETDDVGPHARFGGPVRRALAPSARFAGTARRAATPVVLAAVALGLAPGAAQATATAPTTPALTTPVPTTPVPTTPAAVAATAAPPATTPGTAIVPTTPPPVIPPATTSATTDEAGMIPTAATKSYSYAARLVVPVTVRSQPSRRSRKITGLKPFGSWNGGPVVLQIAAVKMVGKVRWLRVRLPIRPNGATGWLPQSSVEVRKLRYRLVINRRMHSLTVFKDGARVKSGRVVVGAPGTPTPRGVFAVLEVVRQPKGEDIGPWALHLTAHSDVLENFGGGPGRVAIHGRAGDLLKDPLGSSRSHGCIRISNSFVTYLHAVATEGTPVQIV